MNVTIKTAFVDEIFTALIPTTRILPSGTGGVVLWQAHFDRMMCKFFCDLEFCVIKKVSV